MFQEGCNEDEGWKMPGRKARLKPSPLRAPQPDVATPVKPAPHLSAPQPKEATVAKPLCAPQPFSNGPGADIDGTERRYKRKTRVSSNHRRKSGSSSNSSNSKRRSSRRVHRERKNSTTSRTSRTSKCSFGSGNTMEPDDDAGAQPLQGNIVRKPSFVASLAEASNVPYAAVAVVGSNSTAQTTETSFDQSAISNNRPLHYNNSRTIPATVTQQSSYRRKFPPHSWASKTSFTGEIVSSSRPRMSSVTNTDDGYRTVQQGRISTSARSGTTTEDRFSSTSFSMEMGYPDSREFSIVASVVDEAQLEAEFAERMKSRIVEAVEVRPSITGDEEALRSSNSYSYTHNNRGVSNSHSGSNSNSNSSDQEVVNLESAPEGDGNDIEASPGEETQTPSPRDLVRINNGKKRFKVSLRVLASS
eukprot:CAMPEP_0116083782 /NCGR_PEP_ID=MMETSP0327-20121206/3459_1 /TAXON_ID=44447 /ORGANISM="Pseudo-nitzschia delicatissima, Strain B596" /LENGTH=416 /DNA_ID=CAMNT_0003574697 /DNA_START=37 /DNA_END=1291 /DNA_ORIENTATION=-